MWSYGLARESQRLYNLEKKSKIVVYMVKGSTDVIEELEILLNKLMVLRGHFPYMPEGMIGQRIIKTAPIYTRALGKDIIFDFGEPLTSDDIREINEIGGFLNENVLIRLCAILEEHKILKSGENVDEDIEGSEAAILTKKLRNAYAHSLGIPDAKDKALFKRLNNYLKPLKPFEIENAESFPNSIDTVIIPLIIGCQRYTEGILKKTSSKKG